MRMIEEKQFKAAEQWATFVGKALVITLINRYLDLKLLKNASDLIEKNNIKQDSLEVHHMYKKSEVESFAEKGLWEYAEFRTNENKQLLEHLVYLAREAGYPEKADELCKQYTLDGVGVAKSQGDIEQVDNPAGLERARLCIEECNVIGVDCEWKPKYVKGSKHVKVSIMQISSEKAVFILDLINLSEDEPKSLDKCLQCILHSSSILKLGE
ncbi:uncharacterized protein LOC113315475 [Papaver somniferum]|nr:uncharacterized protein LOC113315475 [Papaver somniferum]